MTDSPPPAPGYSLAPYAPRPVRPPLTARAKRGAAIAGAVGFVLLGLGYAMVAFAIGIALVAVLIALIVRAGNSLSSPSPQWFSGIEQFLAGFDFRPFIVPLVFVGILGLVVMAVAIVTSGRVLAAHRVRRPWAVTWAGVGIAVVASWVVSGAVGVFTNVGLGAVKWNSSSAGSSLVALLVVSAVLSLASNAVVGWLSWWWMAHALRAAATAPEAVAVADRA